MLLDMLGVKTRNIKIAPEIFRKIKVVDSHRKSTSVSDGNKSAETCGMKKSGKYNIIWPKD